MKTRQRDGGPPPKPWPPPFPGDGPLAGTDDESRDVVSRFLWGMNIALIFGLAYVTLTSVVGISVGAIQGYFGDALI